MPKNKSINLLPQEEFEASNLGRVLHWAMGTFRIIVIVTEMIVMAAFLSRFWLDAENSNLSDSIKIATSQIQVQADFEKKFREIQRKLAIFKQITSNPKDSDRIQSLASKTPNGITISSLEVNNKTASIKGSTESESNVAQFISNLKADTGLVKKVDLDSLDSSEENQKLLFFQIDVTF